MSAKPGTQIIENLTSYINEITGGEDDNLSDAVATLASGYGKISIDGMAWSTQLSLLGPILDWVFLYISTERLRPRLQRNSHPLL